MVVLIGGHSHELFVEEYPVRSYPVLANPLRGIRRWRVVPDLHAQMNMLGVFDFIATVEIKVTNSADVVEAFYRKIDITFVVRHVFQDILDKDLHLKVKFELKSGCLWQKNTITWVKTNVISRQIANPVEDIDEIESVSS